MPNFKKLDALTLYIRKHPEEHDQGHWSRKTACGTTCCAAGHQAILDGHTLEYHTVLGDFDAIVASKTTTGELISTVAARSLGLTDAQSDELFTGTGESVYDLEVIIDRWRTEVALEKKIKTQRKIIRAAKSEIARLKGEQAGAFIDDPLWHA